MSAPAMLPPVSGRHRNRVLASARKTRAIELKLQGLTYQQVADELGYANKGTVFKLIKDAQASQLTEAVEELRQLELDRLDALQQAMWPLAMAGDIAAAEGVRRVIETRCRVLGLTGSSRNLTAACGKPQTVVLLQDDCRLHGCAVHVGSAAS